MSDLREILDLYDRLVAACDGVVSAEAVESAAEVGRAARRRVQYLGETVVIAFAGGTGSGKSSLLNALAGEEVSPPGAVRPTTGEPVAWLPSNPEPGLTRLLDDLGIQQRVGQQLHSWLAVIDLPDTDSFVAEHRARVDRLLPLLDGVVWVMDPEKYQDARLHHEHLKPVAGHADRFVFALNQIDRVPPDQRDTLRVDLQNSLAADGISEPTIVLTAGDPPDGLPIGLEELLEAIQGMGQAAEVVARRVVDEVVAASERLVAPLGGAAGTGFVSRWTEARNAVASSIATAVEEDLRRVGAETARRDAAAVSAWMGPRRPSPAVVGPATQVPTGVSAPVRRLVDDTATSLDPGSRAVLYEAASAVDEAVGAVAVATGATTTVPLPTPPAWWSSVRLLSYVSVAVMVLGLVLVYDAWRSGEAMVFGVAAVVGGVALLAGARAWVRRSATARVEAALAQRRDESAGRASAELERRVGRPLRTVLRARSAPGAAYTELMLAVGRYEERDT